MLHFFVALPFLFVSKQVKCSRYRPGVAQRVGRGIALLFHDRGTRRGWVVSSTPRPHFTPAKDPVPILQEAGWATGPVLTGGKSRPHRDSIPDRPAHSHSPYWLSYPAYFLFVSISVLFQCCCELRLRMDEFRQFCGVSGTAQGSWHPEVGRHWVRWI